MMRTIICTGNGGSGSALVAAATAAFLAQSGRRTLLTSIGPTHNLGPLLGIELSNTSQSVGPNLDAWTLHAAEDLNQFFNQTRPHLPGTMGQLSSDELPLILGSDFFLCAERLRRAEQEGYAVAVVDAGVHDALLRVLSLPDSFRWFVRLLLGLDRGPGQSSNSVGRAMLPSSLLPYEWVSAVQDARVKFETLRDRSVALPRTTIRFVLRPDSAALDEARLAIPALHLHGLAMEGLVVGPLLPADTDSAGMAAVVQEQQFVVHESARFWDTLPLLRLPLTATPGNVAQLAALGQELYHADTALALPEPNPPIIHGDQAEPFLAIFLPGVRRESLQLTVSGDELIVRVGPYRRHILLPEGLRGQSNIRASREGERLVVRLRSA